MQILDVQGLRTAKVEEASVGLLAFFDADLPCGIGYMPELHAMASQSDYNRGLAMQLLSGHMLGCRARDSLTDKAIVMQVYTGWIQTCNCIAFRRRHDCDLQMEFESIPRPFRHTSFIGLKKHSRAVSLLILR